MNSPTFRRINTTNKNISKISKTILDKINKKSTPSIQVNQFKNSFAVIKWFKNIKNKNNCSFIVFDIEKFLSIYFLTSCY